jgi:hypothetical protein
MRHCPKCSYDNPDSSGKCGICSAPLAGVPLTYPAPKRSSVPWLLLLAGLVFICVGVAIFCTGGEKNPVAAAVAPEADGYTYEGVLYSLDAMKGVKFLPLSDMRRVKPLLYCEDEKVGFLAAQMLGGWSRTAPWPEARAEFFEALLDGAASGKWPVRRQAAAEAARTAGQGFPVASYLPRIRSVSAGLAREKDEDLNAAGFFLGSMAGLSDLAPEMKKALSSAPSPHLRLYAACALSRLGAPEGDKYLFSLAVSEDAAEMPEAVSCLSYSVSPEADSFLKKASSGKLGVKTAAPARIALTLRKQLAIINH